MAPQCIYKKLQLFAPSTNWFLLTDKTLVRRTFTRLLSLVLSRFSFIIQKMSGTRYTATVPEGGHFFAGILPSFFQAKQDDRLSEFYAMAHALWEDRFPIPWEWEINDQGEFDYTIVKTIVERQKRVSFPCSLYSIPRSDLRDFI